MLFMPWMRESDLNAFGGAASLVCFNHVFALVVTHTAATNIYLEGMQVSLSVLSSHHTWPVTYCTDC